MIYGMGGGTSRGWEIWTNSNGGRAKNFGRQGGPKLLDALPRGGCIVFYLWSGGYLDFFQSLVGGLDLFLPWSGGVELNFRPRPGKIFHYPGRNLDWDFFKKKMLSRIYILKMNFHITDLFHLFDQIKMYFVFIM